MYTVTRNSLWDVHVHHRLILPKDLKSSYVKSAGPTDHLSTDQLMLSNTLKASQSLGVLGVWVVVLVGVLALGVVVLVGVLALGVVVLVGVLAVGGAFLRCVFSDLSRCTLKPAPTTDPVCQQASHQKNWRTNLIQQGGCKGHTSSGTSPTCLMRSAFLFSKLCKIWKYLKAIGEKDGRQTWPTLTKNYIPRCSLQSCTSKMASAYHWNQSAYARKREVWFLKKKKNKHDTAFRWFKTWICVSHLKLSLNNGFCMKLGGKC